MRNRRLLVGILILGIARPFCLGQGDVSQPAKRQAVLDLAKQLLAKESSAVKPPAGLVDPFNPPAFGAVPVAGKPAAKAHVVISDREILQQIAPSIQPSGMVMFGDQPLLLFGEKKLKVGDSLTITFEGRQYLIVVSGIGQSSFKIRLNHEEITRPITSGNAP